MILGCFELREDLVEAIGDQIFHKRLLEYCARGQYRAMGEVFLCELARMKLDVVGVAPATPFGNFEDGVYVKSTIELGWRPICSLSHPAIEELNGHVPLMFVVSSQPVDDQEQRIFAV